MMTYLELNSKERILLERIISDSKEARQALRAYALIWLDESDSVEVITQRLSVSRQTICNWAIRFQQRQDFQLPSRVTDAPRSGRPRIAKGIIDPRVGEGIEH